MAHHFDRIVYDEVLDENDDEILVRNNGKIIHYRKHHIVTHTTEYEQIDRIDEDTNDKIR